MKNYKNKLKLLKNYFKNWKIMKNLKKLKFYPIYSKIIQLKVPPPPLITSNSPFIINLSQFNFPHYCRFQKGIPKIPSSKFFLNFIKFFFKKFQKLLFFIHQSITKNPSAADKIFPPSSHNNLIWAFLRPHTHALSLNCDSVSLLMTRLNTTRAPSWWGSLHDDFHFLYRCEITFILLLGVVQL